MPAFALFVRLARGCGIRSVGMIPSAQHQMAQHNGGRVTARRRCLAHQRPTGDFKHPHGSETDRHHRTHSCQWQFRPDSTNSRACWRHRISTAQGELMNAKGPAHAVRHRRLVDGRTTCPPGGHRMIVDAGGDQLALAPRLFTYSLTGCGWPSLLAAGSGSPSIVCARRRSSSAPIAVPVASPMGTRSTRCRERAVSANPIDAAESIRR